jgi:hypothetical protein
MTDDEMIEFERLKTARDSLLLKVANLRGQLETIAADEREACAEIAEKQRYAMHISLTSHPPQNGTAVAICNEIRARGQA